ncbi:MAG: tetratricopeptide repeat protein [Magnetococcales bacterium]|nr:tetratricopeptide repeat protein [Magnetococcales bacterium]
MSLELAIEHHLAGRLAEAEACYVDVLTRVANHAGALHGLGLLKWQAGQWDVARRYLLDAVATGPDEWRYNSTLGHFLAATGQPAEAVPAFECARNLRGDDAATWFGLANALHAVGRLQEAVAAYRQTVVWQPDNVEALNNLGVALDALGQEDDAVAAFRHGLALRSDYAPLYNNLGNWLLKRGAVDDAIVAFRQGLALDENSAELWFNHGNALAARWASPEAVEAYQRALAIDPAHVKVLVNLANTLRLRGETHAALVHYRRAIELAPRFFDAHNNIGVALLMTGQIHAAIASLGQAMAIDPNNSVVHNNLGNVFKSVGRLDEAIAHYRRAVTLNPHDMEAHSNLVYTLSFHPGYDAYAILAEAQRFASLHLPPRPPTTHRSPGRVDVPKRRLRIGYVSPDFRNHCQSLFTMPLLAHHDHERFSIHCYAQLAHPDEMTQRLAAHADVWRSTHETSDVRVAEMIEGDGIDILVDLTMHMAHGRPMLFACRPAPVQVAWLAYPGTTGLPAMDYRLTDPWLDPPGLGDDCYTERSIRLPDTFWCYDPLVSGLQPNALPALTTGHITFGCLNNFCKVSDATLERFGDVMARVPGSRLILLAPPGGHRRRVCDLLGLRGVTPERIEFVACQPRSHYLLTYQRIDLCLDTLPYNGHTTSLDACWMGVPVVTQVGSTVVGRAGWSQLNNLGLVELAACDDQAFVDTAVALATDSGRLGWLRSTLRGRLERSPLMDGQRFARAVEAVYCHIWQKR